MDIKDVSKAIDEIQQIKHFSIPTEEKKSRIMAKVADGFSAISDCLHAMHAKPTPIPEQPIIDTKKLESDRLFERFEKAHNYSLNIAAEVRGMKDWTKLLPECAICYNENAIDDYLNFTGNKVKSTQLRHVDSTKALDLYDPTLFRKKPCRMEGFRDGDEIK